MRLSLAAHPHKHPLDGASPLPPPSFVCSCALPRAHVGAGRHAGHWHRIFCGVSRAARRPGPLPVLPGCRSARWRIAPVNWRDAPAVACPFSRAAQVADRPTVRLQGTVGGGDAGTGNPAPCPQEGAAGPFLAAWGRTCGVCTPRRRCRRQLGTRHASHRPAAPPRTRKTRHSIFFPLHARGRVAAPWARPAVCRCASPRHAPTAVGGGPLARVSPVSCAGAARRFSHV
jgi:hypothetical protein